MLTLLTIRTITFQVNYAAHAAAEQISCLNGLLPHCGSNNAVTKCHVCFFALLHYILYSFTLTFTTFTGFEVSSL